MEEAAEFSDISDGEIIGIKFSLASHKEICTASVSGSSITHASQLTNPYLGLPLEFGRCESCGTSEAGSCEGHFGYIELPVAIYHPSHVSELRRMLNLLCLKCLKVKKNKSPAKNVGIAEQLLGSCCPEATQVSVNDIYKDGYWYLQLKVPSKKRVPDGFWKFLERYGYRYGGSLTEDLPKRTLLPDEVLEIIKRLPSETIKKLESKHFFPQSGYILKFLPVPPNCLSVPEISDGITIMSTDPSMAMLKKVLRQVEIIKSSRSIPNFESTEVEANELQIAVDQYLQARGTVKASRGIDERFGVNKEAKSSSTKVWLEKMRTLFIRKGSGFSSRTVITGDAYKEVNEVGIPYDIAKGITFEERVNDHNINYLQNLVDNNLCLTFIDGSTRFSLKEGSKGHTFLRTGQVVHRRIMDGDIVFINRPPTTHKHSLQALKVYVHDDHIVKINPLICGPLSADFDGDCIHLFYPQSLAARAEVVELFSVEKQLLSSHSGNLILQLASDSLLSLKMLFETYFMDKVSAQQLAMFSSSSLPQPALWKKAPFLDPHWTALQVLQSALPASFDCSGDRFLVKGSEILILDFNRDVISSVISDIVTSIFFKKGSEEVLKFFNSVQPLLMENIFEHGFSVGLEDFSISLEAITNIQKDIQAISPLLFHLRSKYNELVELNLENEIRSIKASVTNFFLNSSALGDLIDTKSDSAVNKVVQQIGFLGVQMSDRGKFYSKTLFEDVSDLYSRIYPPNVDYPSAEHGLIRSCFFYGLDPYEEMVHSISTREILVRSSRGLTEPGTLFKNLMAILRDVVICYDGTVRNVCSNSIIQFEYGTKAQNLYPAGEPVGVLAATAMSNPAYKAVLDSSPSSNNSWEMMKEILLCKVSFGNEPTDRRVILYLNDCYCGRNYCQENAAYLVKNQLGKVSLKDTAVEFMIEYRNQDPSGGCEVNAGLVGHIHLNESMLKRMNIGINEILEKCQENINSLRRKKIRQHLKTALLSVSECCSFHKSPDETSEVPCLLISLKEDMSLTLEESSQILADSVCPFLLGTVIKGDSRICSANITWISPEATTWIRHPHISERRGELALDVVLEKSAVKQSGDAWRIVLDSCLPVLHLIDTKRSIPYGIKQIQKLLGISCAFDQAIQRLSTSVSKVSKGVLKEHLILLANSMTCPGNLIGFNSGGYKALSRSFNIQVPFTEATLTTPKRCFERAAEKCHTDSLTSIVASCSWAKHVAVGTGSRFDILWDTREMGLNQEETNNVYDFLGVVGAASGKETTTGCLGEEIEEIILEDDGEVCASPELEFDQDKPVFEDGDEFKDIPDDDWGFKATQETNNDDWGFKATQETNNDDWGFKATQETNNDDWGSKATQDTDNGGWGKVSSGKEDSSNSGWNSKSAEKNVATESTWGAASSAWDNVSTKEKTASEDDNSNSSGWGAKSSGMKTTESPWGKSTSRVEVDSDNTSGGWNVKSSESKTIESSKMKTTESAWGNNASRGEVDSGSNSGGWNVKLSGSKTTESAWGKDKAGAEVMSGDDRFKSGRGTWSGGNKRNSENEDVPSRKPNDSSWDSSSAEHDGGWNANSFGANSTKSAWGTDKASVEAVLEDDRSKSACNAWSSGTKTTETESEDVPFKKPNDSGWGSSPKQIAETSDAWLSPSVEKQPSQWGKQGGESFKEGGAGGWGSDEKQPSQWGGSNEKQPSQWGKQGGKSFKKGSAGPTGDWGSNEKQPGQWGKRGRESFKKGSSGGWGSDEKQPTDENQPSQWGGNDEKQSSQWGTKGGESFKKGSSGGWGSDEKQPIDETQPSQWGGSDEKQPSQWGGSDEKQPSQWGGSDEKQPSQWGGSDEKQPNQWGGSDEKQPNQWGGSDEKQPNQWGKQGGESFRKGGWGSDEGWKIKKNRPNKPWGNENSTVIVQRTATGQRLDLFTTEEQDPLSLVEPIMLAIRRIMHKDGYNDGDPLASEDQTYIVDNVFANHPDKDSKMGCGIDYIMVSKHFRFQDTRCFYVVLTDGHKEDFSYRKCLENLVKSKYPDISEAFNGKYFRKPGGNRDRQTTPEQQSTPEQFSTPEQNNSSEQFSTPEQNSTQEQQQSEVEKAQ
ncbi:hypothetical protein CsatB_009936 [Cannabis sativa]